MSGLSPKQDEMGSIPIPDAIKCLEINGSLRNKIKLAVSLSHVFSKQSERNAQRRKLGKVPRANVAFKDELGGSH